MLEREDDVVVHSTAEAAKTHIEGFICSPFSLKKLKNMVMVVQVFPHCLAGDDVAIKIGEEEGKVAEKAVHEALEGLSCAFKSKRA